MLIQSSTIIHYLHNLPELREEIENDKRKLADLRNMEIDSFQVCRISQCDGSKYVRNKNSPVEIVAIPRADKIRAIENEMFFKMNILDACEKIIKYEKGTAAEIIHLRYLNKKQGVRTPGWKEIADQLHLTVDAVWQENKILVRKIANAYNKSLDLATAEVK